MFDPDHKPLNPQESSRLRKSLLKIPHSNLHYNYRTENIVNKWPQFCEAECLKNLNAKNIDVYNNLLELLWTKLWSNIDTQEHDGCFPDLITVGG